MTVKHRPTGPPERPGEQSRGGSITFKENGMYKPGELELGIVLSILRILVTRMDQTESTGNKAGSSLLGVSQASQAHPRGVSSFQLNMRSVTEVCGRAMQYDRALEKCASSKC